jgi:hypothetical protein
VSALSQAALNIDIFSAVVALICIKLLIGLMAELSSMVDIFLSDDDARRLYVGDVCPEHFSYWRTAAAQRTAARKPIVLISGAQLKPFRKLPASCGPVAVISVGRFWKHHQSSATVSTI